MPELTPPAHQPPLQLDDWSFLSLQRDPQVMCSTSPIPRPQAAIRKAFDSRLPPWTPEDERSCAWWCATGDTPLGLTGYQHHQRDIAELASLRPGGAGPRATATNRYARCALRATTGGVRRLTANVTAGNRRLSGYCSKPASGWRKLRENYWLNGRWHNVAVRSAAWENSVRRSAPPVWARGSQDQRVSARELPHAARSSAGSSLNRAAIAVYHPGGRAPVRSWAAICRFTSARYRTSPQSPVSMAPAR